MALPECTEFESKLEPIGHADGILLLLGLEINVLHTRNRYIKLFRLV